MRAPHGRATALAPVGLTRAVVARAERYGIRLLASLCLLAAAASALPGQAPEAAPLRLRGGDAVRLQVADEPALAGEYLVTEEGLALLPLVGLIRVAGRPFPEVREEIVSGFRRSAVETEVLVSPLLRIAVLGEVRQPGLIPVDPTYTIADVIAAAGGISPTGDPSKIMLIGDGEPVRFSLSDDPAILARRLRPGEQIVVDRRGWARENVGILLGGATSLLTATITTLLLR